MKKLSSVLFIVFFVVVSSGAAGAANSATAFYLPESKLTVRDQVTLLAIDDQSLQQRENLVLTLNKPEIRQAPVLTPESENPNAPDSMATHFYGTVLHDQGKYRMWYYALSLRAEPDDFKMGPICYAESDDGLHWTKPNLGQVEINGSSDNNAIDLPDEKTQCAAVILDEDDSDPARRYKMAYVAWTHTWVFRTATSADGIHWDVSDDYAVDSFLEMGCLLKFGDRYIVHGQGIGNDAKGLPEGRQGYASTSNDFENWEQEYREAFRLPEPEEVKLRGLTGDYPQVHLGVGGTSFGNVAVGLYGIWHNPAEAERRKKGWYGAGLIRCDLGLVVSNDGVTFREPVKGHVLISGKESPVTPAAGIVDPTILCQANGILNVGERTLIYHDRWRNATNSAKDYYAEIALATLPRDRWGSLSLTTDASHGTVWSTPITLPAGGCDISLNADGAESITVELADESGKSLAEFSGENQGKVQAAAGNVSKVSWSEDSLSSLGGKTVRLKLGITSTEGKIYAVYLRSAGK